MINDDGNGLQTNLKTKGWRLQVDIFKSFKKLKKTDFRHFHDKNLLFCAFIGNTL